MKDLKKVNIVIKVLYSSLFFVPFFFKSLESSAQNEYSGDYVFNGISGQALFEFRRGPENSVLKQGTFEFLRKERDADDKTVLYKTEVKGTYQDDLKNEIWNYLDEVHRVELNDIKDFKLEYDIQSRQIILRATYKAGKPDGKWTFEENEFKEGVLRKKSQVEDFQFKEGEIQGNFQYKRFEDDKTHFVRGQVRERGFMHGEWTFVYPKDDKLVSEIRNYENGFLLGLVKRDLETNDVIEEVVFFETIDKLNKVNASENKGFRIADRQFGLRFNDGFLSSAPQYKAQNSGNEFISQFIRDILRYDEEFVDQDGKLIAYPMHTKKFVFELNRAEQRIIEDLPAKFDRLKRITEEYKERNSISLNRQKSDTLALAYAFFNNQNEKLKEFTEIISLFRSKDIQFYDLNHLTAEGLDFLTEKETVEYNFRDSVRTKEFNFDVKDLRGNFYTSFSSYVDQMQEKTNEIRNKTDKALSFIEENEDILALQERIKERKDKLDQLFSDEEKIQESASDIIQAVEENILQINFNSINERFMRAERFSQKQDLGNQLLDLIEEMESKFPVLNSINNEWEKVDMLYMEEVFNPFTYTRYDQRTQARLFENAERLFEYYRSNLMSEKDYAEIKTWTRKIENLTNRLKDLNGQDTRAIERRLNRRTSMSKIESILEL